MGTCVYNTSNHVNHADSIGEKVVVFSQCLKTVDYIETILNTSDWEIIIDNIPFL